jgi:hypothetical protein
MYVCKLGVFFPSPSFVAEAEPGLCVSTTLMYVLITYPAFRRFE